MNDKEKVWERLKYVKRELPSTRIVMTGRSFGKTTLAMQSLGRAMRELK